MKSKRSTFSAAVAALALGLSVGVASAQSSTAATSAGGAGTGSSATGGGAAPMAQPGTGTRNDPTRADDKVSRADRKFIEQAAGSGMYEVQVAQLAVAKATDPRVKEFASMLVDHHSAANNELIQLANARRIELPAAPPRPMRNGIEQLGKKTGEDFDRDFIRNVGIKAHEKDIETFESASKDVRDPQLKAWIGKTLPVLKQHLAQARQMPQAGGGSDAARMGGSGGTGGNASGASKTGG